MDRKKNTKKNPTYFYINHNISVASGVGVMLSHGGGSAGSLEQKKSELAKTPVTAPKKPAQDSKVNVQLFVF